MNFKLKFSTHHIECSIRSDRIFAFLEPKHGKNIGKIEVYGMQVVFLLQHHQKIQHQRLDLPNMTQEYYFVDRSAVRLSVLHCFVTLKSGFIISSMVNLVVILYQYCRTHTDLEIAYRKPEIYQMDMM